MSSKVKAPEYDSPMDFKHTARQQDRPLCFKDEATGHGCPPNLGQEVPGQRRTAFQLVTSTRFKSAFDCSRIVQNQLSCLPTQKYYTWVPKHLSTSCPVVVVVHGIARKARAQVEAFASLAQLHSALIVAPLFEKLGNKDYQRLGRAGLGPRADYGLNAILDEVGQTYPVNTDTFYLFGYSAGAQFAHRYAFAYPRRIKALSLGSAGWYTFPARQDYPFGIDGIAGLPDLRFQPGQLAETPIRVYVGTSDTKRDKSLNRSRDIDQQQGRNRLQRARSWVQEMQKFHRQQGFGSQVDLELLPEVGHSFSECVRQQSLTARIMGFFFSPDRCQGGAS